MGWRDSCFCGLIFFSFLFILFGGAFLRLLEVWFGFIVFLWKGGTIRWFPSEFGDILVLFFIGLGLHVFVLWILASPRDPTLDTIVMVSSGLAVAVNGLLR